MNRDRQKPGKYHCTGTGTGTGTGTSTITGTGSKIGAGTGTGTCSGTGTGTSTVIDTDTGTDTVTGTDAGKGTGIAQKNAAEISLLQWSKPQWVHSKKGERAESYSRGADTGTDTETAIRTGTGKDTGTGTGTGTGTDSGGPIVVVAMVEDGVSMFVVAGFVTDTVGTVAGEVVEMVASDVGSKSLSSALLLFVLASSDW